MPVKSKAKIDPTFTNVVDELAESNLALGDAPMAGGARRWQVPPPGEWDGDHSKLEDLAKAFNRDDLNDAYTQVVSDTVSPGTVGDLIGIGIQIGYVAAIERAYRARHASPVRCLIHAAARRKGHGHDAGVLKGGVVPYAADSIAAGQTGE